MTRNSSVLSTSSARHRLRLVSVAILMAVVAAACAESGSDDAATDTTLGATTTTGPVRGGTLVAAASSDPGQLNPAITTSGGVHTASELMFNGLVEINDAGELVPELAESWEVLEDGALYRFKLVEGVTWHDGMPFTSADVKFTFEEALLKFHSRTASMASVLTSIDTPDDLTVEFRFQQPYAPLLQQLNVTEAPIIARHIYEGTEVDQNSEANLAPIGTGPYRFSSYTPEAEIRLTANLNYFKPGLPLLDEVVIRIVPQEENQVASLESGEVQWIFGVPGPQVARLQSNPDIAFLRTGNNPGGANCIMTVGFNQERAVLADVNVRRAIGLALNQEQFLANILFGQGAVAEAPIHSGIAFAHHPSVEVPGFDPDGANRLLDEAGWTRSGDGTRTASGVEGVADGTEFSIDFVHFPTFTQYAQLAQAQLREVGIDLRIGETALAPGGPFNERVFRDRNFDTNVISYCNGLDPEIGVRRMYVTNPPNPDRVAPFQNATGYSNPVMDDLFDQAQAEVDTETRSDLYRQISELAVEDLPYYWLVETVAVRAHRTNCSDFTAAGHFAETAFCR